MNKIKIHYMDLEIEFAINKVKVLYGDNYLLKRKIIKILDNYIKKTNYSEYLKENFDNISVNYNEEQMNPNDFLFFYIETNFDVINDLKLNSKSLSINYLEAKLENIEYNELFNTIKIWIYVKFLDTFFVTKPYLNLFQFLHQFRNPVIYLV